MKVSPTTPLLRKIVEIADIGSALKEQCNLIDDFRAAGYNLTLWCTPRAVVTQITFHDEDAGPDIDKSFTTLAEALEFAATMAIEAAATREKEKENDG